MQRLSRTATPSIPLNDVLTATLKAVKMETVAGGVVLQTPQGRLCHNFRTVFEPAVQKAGPEDCPLRDVRIPSMPGWWNGRHNGLKIPLGGDWQHLENAANPLIFLVKFLWVSSPLIPPDSPHFTIRVPTNFPTPHRLGSGCHCSY